MPGRIPDYNLEAEAVAAGMARVAGIDEVGRGPLAGPVVAAAVILDPGRVPPGLRDSKQLSATRRQSLHDAICSDAQVSVAEASVAEIDALNILRASLLAMRRALSGLFPPAEFALIDGNRLPDDLPCPARAVVGGDARCLSVAAASIVAKVRRDRIMAELARDWPGYGWEVNAGYPTRAHRVALSQLGVSPHHRRSFAPIRNMLC